MATAPTPRSADRALVRSVALDPWAENLGPMALVVHFNPDGRSAGARNYSAQQTDFAASPAVRTGSDRLGGRPPSIRRSGTLRSDTGRHGPSCTTSRCAGHLVGQPAVPGSRYDALFQGQITNWEDRPSPRNYGRSRLHNQRIIPVFRSTGRARYFLTRWRPWVPQAGKEFCTKGPTACSPTNAGRPSSTRSSTARLGPGRGRQRSQVVTPATARSATAMTSTVRAQSQFPVVKMSKRRTRLPPA